MSEHWQNKVKAFLHDPPDKALILCTGEKHEKFAAELWKYLGLEQDAIRLESQGLGDTFPDIHRADIVASTMQRLDLPKKLRGFAVCFTKEPEQAMIKHTVSGREEKTISELIATYGYKQLRIEEWNNGNTIEFLQELRGGDWKKTYFLLWRFLPEKYQLGYILPAETRIPDHSIWDHLDVTSAIFSSLEEGLCLLSVKIPAVQEFIAHSRKLADLWASSHIFSTIIFEGIKVIANKFGPDVIIYPQLRGNPMVDLEEFNGENGNFILYDEGKKLNILRENPKGRLHIANFPNTFLSFVPSSEAKEIAKEVKERIESKWKEIAGEAKRLLKDGAKISIDERLWNKQIDNAIEITSTWLEFFNFDKFNNVKNEIPNDLKKRQEDWLNFTEDSKSYKGLKVERHGLNRYKIFEGNVKKLDVIADNEEEFVKECIKVFDNEKVKVLKSLYEWLRRDPSHFYYTTYELLGTILMQKSRFWNAWKEEPVTGKKCLMCGRRSALLLKDENGNYKVWNGEDWINANIKKSYEHLLKERERLCAVCLVKRLYRDVFRKNFEGAKLPPWESVSEIAARDFIERIVGTEIYEEVKRKDIELIYKEEWDSKDKVKLKYIRELGEKEGEIYKKLVELWEIYGEPNKYYAILMMDGDRIGKWLSGERWKENGEEKGLPNFGEFLHPTFKDKIKEWKENDKKWGEELIKTKRILTPSHHIAISRAMKNFSLYKVPEIVEKFNGFLVYAGGDDVLALFPTDKVLDAAYEIQKFFKEDFYEIETNGKRRKVMGLGNKASMSAGIVFAHYKWPLYDAIERVREAEKKAKKKIKEGGYGRNAFCMTFIKRSGEILTAGGKWDSKNYFDKILELLSPKDEEKRKLSHRFVYDFLDIIRKLKRKDNKRWEEPYISMLKAEVKRLLGERNYKKRLSSDDINNLYENVFLPLINEYVKECLPLENVGIMLKILYDAYRGEER